MKYTICECVCFELGQLTSFIQLQYQRLCIVFQHDLFLILNDEVLELGTNSHMCSTLLSLALITVNNKSYLGSSQCSCILQNIT